MTIKELWLKWERIKVPEDHDINCAHLYPGDMNCNCGKVAAEIRKTKAFEALKAEVMIEED